ncbi:hypothetical protein SLEP1_g27849 [Rubroshorea leprosula]|uniref:F-box domain-containing protein n=1 Tax=Rubroshorea leprosula TaxID=152421 RepID=A0AAV5JRQ1_9ROSI|nr:hypothetical protein SLEP1_g27849 [Rubroshorea leprosula]
MDQEEKSVEGEDHLERLAAMALKNKSHYQENYQGTQNWANLPEDILGKIMRTLKFSERLCMTATCKGWRIPVYGVNNPLHLDGLPWLFMHPHFVESDKLNQFKLYEPGNPKPYFIGKDIINKGGNKLLGARVFSSKFGWVVFRKCLMTSATWSFFLYSPFAENIIQLPDLVESSMGYALFTFSNIPSAHDCIFFLLHQRSVKEAHLYTYRNGEREWKSCDCDISLFGCTHRHGVLKNIKTSKNIVYLDGTLYCMFSCGDNHTLATLNVSEQKWSLKTSSVISADGTGARLMLLESEKGLFVLYKTFLNESKCHIFKYDCSELITIRSLEDHIFFVDGHSAFSIEALGEVKREFCNRIYYKFNNDKSPLSYFSIKDDQVHQDSIIYVSNSPLGARWDNYIHFLDVSRLAK